MDLTSEAIKTLEDLAKRANAVEVEYEGKKFVAAPLKQLVLANEPEADAVNVHSLRGIVDLLSTEVDDDGHDYMVHVVSATEVHLVSTIFGTNRQRETLAIAEPILTPFSFGKYLDIESFVIALQAQFIPSETTAAILKLVGNIKDEKVNTAADDGVTQLATARVGIARLDNVAVPNPVALAPYRTFPEVAQPESKFVLRLKSGVGQDEWPTVALYEADGGAWRVQAMSSIAEWFAQALPEGVKVIG